MTSRAKVILGIYGAATLLAAVVALNPTMRGEATFWLAATGLPWNVLAALAVERVDRPLFEVVWPWLSIGATLLNGALLAGFLTRGAPSGARSPHQKGEP